MIENKTTRTIDERPKNREKDKTREGFIKKEIDCEFLRVKDYV